jgi:hypothetical protein
MRPVKTFFIAAGLAVLTTSTGAMAQSYYDDQACRQYAGQQVAALQGQANAQALGSTLLGAGLGAAIGGAVGGGRGAGIGAASGAVLGGATGVASAQNAAGYAPQQYNAYYAQCMASRRAPPPSYYGPAPAYAPAPTYYPSQGYYAPRY